MDVTTELRVQGYARPSGQIDDALRESLLRVLGATDGAAGRRNLLNEHPKTRSLLRDPLIVRLVHEVLGPDAFVVRATLFDKRPDANWAVTWHQDQAIAVTERVDTPGYGPWSVKQGITHVEPPANVLAAMVAVRIHLDPCSAENGALVALPGSHRHGRVDIETPRDRYPEVHEQVLPVEAGGVLLMKPLCLHRSSRSTTGGRRRVIHFDCAAADLPAPLAWAVREPLNDAAKPR